MSIFRKSKGFTLIELLVVISIISLLSSVVLASLNSARAKARDAQRSISIRQVQTALEMYYHDNGGTYPSSADVVFPGVLATALVPTYIKLIPTDPVNTVPYHYYTASQNPALFYAIRINYENKPACYVCAGPLSVAPGCSIAAGPYYWGISICQ
ncbi:MAG TPA: hypothetical protein DCS23_03050 [Candidatus Yonathbacteria bacterium]|nr:hypothetical protein [Candidatus Yonathbacteria bacterium]